MAKYGPFVHALNKGGLEAIRSTGLLKPSEARAIAGGSSAVRAHVGSFVLNQQQKRWFADPDKIFIEFTTDVAPSPHPAVATWYMPEGGSLRIQIIGIYNGAGVRQR